VNLQRGGNITNKAMKLYATTTSERATKGQGGNEYLIIKIKDESKKEIAFCVVDSENIVFSIKDGKAIKEPRKGEKQKGE